MQGLSRLIGGQVALDHQVSPALVRCFAKLDRRLGGGLGADDAVGVVLGFEDQGIATTGAADHRADHVDHGLVLTIVVQVTPADQVANLAELGIKVGAQGLLQCLAAIRLAHLRDVVALFVAGVVFTG